MCKYMLKLFLTDIPVSRHFVGNYFNFSLRVICDLQVEGGYFSMLPGLKAPSYFLKFTNIGVCESKRIDLDSNPEPLY